jgi:hypothetical protein
MPVADAVAGAGVEHHLEVLVRVLPLVPKLRLGTHTGKLCFPS